jgi:cellobiose epimerase
VPGKAIQGHLDPARLRRELSRTLLAEVHPAYTGGIDREGFVPVRGPEWQPCPAGPRRLVHAARMTWTAAELARRTGEPGQDYLAHARHGARILLEKFVDRDRGGMFWEVVPGQGPSSASKARKHLYGISFGIYAMANAGEALGDPDLIDTALQQFEWLEQHGARPGDPGLEESFETDGSPVRDDPEPGDEIGRPAGYRSMNAQLHLMEALTRLHTACPDPRVGARLRRVLDLFLDRMVTPPGCTHLYYMPDWKPVPGPTSYGHDVEIGYLMIEAARAAQPDREADAWHAARMLTDHAIDHAVDHERGGMANEGFAFGHVCDATRVWWVQAEAINACSLMDARYGHETDRYRRALAAVWSFCDRWLIDHEHGGWRWAATPDGKPTGPTEKINRWKTVYHTTRALLETSERLEHAERR